MVASSLASSLASARGDGDGGILFPSASWNDSFLHKSNAEQDHSSHPVLRPLVISGPSGVGKGTLINMLFVFYNQKVDWIEPGGYDDHHPLSFSVSHTTSEPVQL